MSLRVQFALVGVVAVLVEAGLGALVLTTEGPSRIAIFLVASALATTVLTAGMWWVLGLPPRNDGPEDDDDGGPGGAPPTPPPWWPEFERDLRAYTREREGRVRSGR